MNKYVPEMLDLYCQMKKYGAVVYGAGENGKKVITYLKQLNIKVNIVADKYVASCEGFLCVNMDELVGDDNLVCIITPKLIDECTISVLKSKYKYIMNMDFFHFLEYHIPIEYVPGDEILYKPFNHYESPYANEHEKSMIFNDNVLGIDFFVEDQKELARFFSSEYDSFIALIQNNNSRYKIDNYMYGEEDAFILYNMIKKFKPKKIIEIGSGFSTCISLDTNEEYLNNSIDISCIEPYPERLYANIKLSDNLKVFDVPVQNVNVDYFNKLSENDILFIDSSHVAKFGGDVLYEYFYILPKLKSGVIIHIHDIFSNFEYPVKWVNKGIYYNEAYILRALLTDSNRYKVIYFNHMMHNYLKELLKKDISGGGSIWLKVN